MYSMIVYGFRSDLQQLGQRFAPLHCPAIGQSSADRFVKVAIEDAERR
jgi:hypothetical protein